ncbi:HD domain-containing protein [Streptomyces sp. NPDC059373]
MGAVIPSATEARMFALPVLFQGRRSASPADRVSVPRNLGTPEPRPRTFLRRPRTFLPRETGAWRTDRIVSGTGGTLAVMAVVGWAYELAESLLADPLPRRWAHSRGVAVRAEALAPVVGDEIETLWAAAVLHDIGYAPAVVETGFHPLDGARHLRTLPAVDQRIVRLVANHSFALLEAEERGLRETLEAEFPLPDDDLLVDALVYCDMTTTPDGAATTSYARVEEILGGYGTDSVVGRFIRRAAPAIHGSVDRVQARAAEVGLTL